MRYYPDRASFLTHFDLTSKECAEIGVQSASFSREIASYRPATLHLVDPWHHFAPDLYPSEANVAQAEQDTLFDSVCLWAADYNHKNVASKSVVMVHRQTSFEASNAFRDFSLDWVYIDANHAYEFVISDLYLWYPKVKPGGWITGHDWNIHKQKGVVRALEHFQKVTQLQISVMSQEADFQSWAIQKRP